MDLIIKYPSLVLLINQHQPFNVELFGKDRISKSIDLDDSLLYIANENIREINFK